MQCDYYDAHVCRSCALMGVSHEVQVADKDVSAREALAAWPDIAWLEPFAGAEVGFRNKAKMAVSGETGAVTLGILDADHHGIDLRACGLMSPRMHEVLEVVSGFVNVHRLVPYSVARDSGELKYVLVTEAPSGDLMLRFVLRSRTSEAVIRENLPALLDSLPGLHVVSLNVQPERKAIIEGPEEIVLTEADTLTMEVGGFAFHLGAGGFFQTNTEVAAALYAQAAAWVDELDAAGERLARVWDLYCGVGGFAMHLSAPGREVLGIETSEPAIAAARRTAAEHGLSDTRFVVGDATEFVLDAAGSTTAGAATVGVGENPGAASGPGCVVVNPPRRGLGARLCAALEAAGSGDSGVTHLVYSSCNIRTLAKDLARMPAWMPVAGRVLDMFPQTHHFETIVLLERA